MSEEADVVATDLTGLLVATGFQVVLSLGLIAGFSVLRPRNKRVYEPRSKYAPPEKRPQTLDWRPTAWIQPSLKTKEDDLVSKIGLDAVMFLRFLWFSVQFFLGLTAVGIPLCIFHFYIQPSKAEQKDGAAFPNPELATLTMKQLSKKPNILWLHAVLVYLFSAYAYWLLYKMWMDWIGYRRAFFLTPEYQEGHHNRTLLLTNIPEDMRSVDGVMRFMHGMHLKHDADQAVIGRNVEELPDLIREHQEETARIEDAFAKYFQNSNRPTHRIDRSCCCFGGEKVDTITHCGERLHRLEEQIYEMRARGDTAFAPSPYAFVSYKCAQDTHFVANKLQGPGAVALRSNSLNPPAIKLSPNFDDIIWDNLGITTKIRRSRQLIAVMLVVGVSIAWTPFILLVTAVTGQAQLQRYAPWLARWMARSKAASVFFSSVLIPILFALLQILPPIGFGYLARFQGISSKTGSDKSVMHKFFAFQVYQYAAILLASLSTATIGQYLSGGGSFQSISQSLLHEASLAYMQKSNFFMTIIVTELSSVGLELMQGIPLAIHFIRRHFFSNTPRKEFEYKQPPDLPYGAVYAQLLIKFLLGVSYSVAVPLILPFTSLFFSVAYLVYKYQLLYVYETPLETGGSWWPKVFTLVCASMAAFQTMTLGGILLVTGSNTRGQATMVFIAVVFNVVFWWSCRRWLAPQGQFVSKRVPGSEKNSATITRPTNSHEDESLEDRVYNPALVKPLQHVWVWPRSREILHKYYQSQYYDLDDYIRKKAPLRPKVTNQYDDVEEDLKRKTTSRRNAKRVISFHRRHPLHLTRDDAEQPPELEAVAQQAGEDLPVLVATEDDGADYPDDVEYAASPSSISLRPVRSVYKRDDAVPRPAETLSIRPYYHQQMRVPANGEHTPDEDIRRIPASRDRTY
ncbi:hypothetical protein PhCBS80983_g01814 [Powellomyces hirtus]|uniref:CSC1/OSCA1-like 7TM region domain-containing protein n=1 Tax=Powellomyces hirtus TaxID=109895 RepID=A0A507E8N4_9FUNG|nr:hypothetical protein PhCBS80983_g01814 [Powellomyces hirtus]